MLERKGTRTIDGQESGISGLKDLGVRELTYRIAFFACTVIPANGRVSCFALFVLIRLVIFKATPSRFRFFLVSEEIVRSNDSNIC